MPEQPTPAERVRACVESLLGTRLELVTKGRPRAEPEGEAASVSHIIVDRGEWFGDPWSGSTAETRVTVEGLRHPTLGTPLTLRLDYSEHDLSGQTDSWTVTLAGFPADESAAIRDALDPRGKVRNLNPNLQYRWVIDGREGCTPRRTSASWPPKR
ncbi:MAG: hypothetical protein KC593_11405 [Myxococcales bacterium]|nr:hypothetical protein [Myxococcales bacterium]MCB9629581.1 hypothetical protein [Sandaracinaceae bacterium]